MVCACNHVKVIIKELHFSDIETRKINLNIVNVFTIYLNKHYEILLKIAQ